MSAIIEDKPQQPDDEKDTKMLGAHVPKDLYWEFKEVAAARKEDLKDAIQHAARMYIDLVSTKKEA